MSAGVIFIVLIIFLAIAIPIGVSLGLTSVFTAFFTDVPINVEYIVRSMATALDSYPLLAIPLFIFAGTIMAKG